MAEEPAAALHTRRQRPPFGRKSGSKHDSASARESGPDPRRASCGTVWTGLAQRKRPLLRDWGTASGRHLLTVSTKPCDEYCFAYALLRVLCVYWHSCRVSALIPRPARENLVCPRTPRHSRGARARCRARAGLQVCPDNPARHYVARGWGGVVRKRSLSARRSAERARYARPFRLGPDRVRSRIILFPTPRLSTAGGSPDSKGDYARCSTGSAMRVGCYQETSQLLR